MIRLLILILTLLPGLAMAEGWPRRFVHKYGETMVQATPRRVASLDFGGGDDLLALGVQPVALRLWTGEGARGVTPWAEALLSSQPVLLQGAPDFERIAATRPDVILAFWSGITPTDYAKLSRIAPVIATPQGQGDFDLPWEARARLAARALGREAAAEARITALQGRLRAIAARHPHWQGKTVSLAFDWDGTPGAFLAHDVRARPLAQLGFVTPPAIMARAAPGAFMVSLSPEDLGPLEADLLLWIGSDAPPRQPMRRFLAAHREGREIVASAELSAALSWSSLLSLPRALDLLLPQIEAALPAERSLP